MLPPVELYVDEVTPSGWYHPLMPLVFRILWMIPGFTAQRMGRFVAKGNGLPENMASKSNDIRTFNRRRRLFPWSLLRTRPQGC